MPQFFATCATSLEYLLVDELKELGAENVKEGLSLVNFDAEWPILYDILMWSRVASRVLYPVAKFEAKDEKALYDQVSIIDWSQHIKSNASFVIHSQSFRSELSHTQFISQRIKDAIVDHYTDMDEQRPDVEFDRPDVVLQCRIRQNQVTLSIDLAGIGLHHRGYREQGGVAPIKENLASALLIRAGWLKRCREFEDKGNDESSQLSLYDPMCGSGTFLIEAAMMALDIAPGTYRDYLGIYGWNQFNSDLWQQTIEKANKRFENNKNKEYLHIMGSDLNPNAISLAQSNLEMLHHYDLSNNIKVNIAGIDQVSQIDTPSSGLVIVNPPYSERLGDFEQVKKLYAELGDLLKEKFSGWNASVLSPDKVFGHSLGIRAKKIYKFNNGSIACELLNFDLEQKNYLKKRTTEGSSKNYKERLSEAALQLNNRIEKNRKKLKSFLKQNDISCYRVYDADLPEYNAAIDVYQDRIHIQEYRAPKSIDEKVAIRRIKDLHRVVAGIFELPLESVYIKQRRQQKGDWQYETKGRDETGQEIEKDDFNIVESGRKFIVNLKDYLDTGLFLDHRNIRQIIAKECRGKSFLNLFCYTGTVSVYAASAGASKTTSVDLSNTYLNWAKDNFDLNGLSLEKNEFIRDDTLIWIKEAVDSNLKYDVIFLDPPTFSNSKKMENHFDIQRDHELLISQCVKLLSDKGTLYFSNNFKQFKMEFDAEKYEDLYDEKVLVNEITKQTTSMDFFRRPLHRCWKIQSI